MIDVGTGDGLFVCRSAEANPKEFFIGIDANPRPLEKVSERIHRKPAKGGLPNVLFIQAAAEDLPHELDGIADEIHVQFPWGSLLQGVATGTENTLGNLRRICAPEGVLTITIGLDPERDRSEIKRLGLKSVAADFVDRELVERYRASGFEIQQSAVLARSEWHALQSSWAKRLRGNPARMLVRIIAHATKRPASNETEHTCPQLTEID